MAQYRDFNDFLKKHSTTEKDGITHTRIGDKKSIFAGKYIINDTELSIFYKLYYKHVFVNGKNEYLTEKQLTNGNSPLLIDFDFRYDSSVTSRQHTKEHIEDIIQLYIESFQKILALEDQTTITTYVMEKPNVNTTDGTLTKDGIHMIFDIKLDHITQCMIRDDILKGINVILEDLNLTNSMESVLDDGISKGHTNWQLYGSRKPGNESYEIKYIIRSEIDKDGDITFEYSDIDSFDPLDLMVKVSARYQNHQTFKLSPAYEEQHKLMKSSGNKKVLKKNRKLKVKFTQEGFNFNVEDITSVDMLTELIEKMFETLNEKEYNIRETHNYLMCLPAKYYDDYNLWIRCGWALHNTDFRMFLSWMLFSSQSYKFNIDDIPKNYEIWMGMKNADTWFDMYDNSKDDRRKDEVAILTHRTVKWWAYKDNPKEFEMIKKDTVDFYVEKCIPRRLSPKSTSVVIPHSDIAMVLYQLNKDKYRCASIKNKTWYKFQDHHWEIQTEGDTDLFDYLDSELSHVFSDKSENYLQKYTQLEDGAGDEDGTNKTELYKSYSNYFCLLSNKLKDTNFKHCIMKEAAHKFYKADPGFINNLDNNPNLICFKNGVLDLESKEFRPGKPDDYITLTTGIEYYDYNTLTHKQREYESEIIDFMNKIFPIEDLNKYMWEHLASTLYGRPPQQRFNIYIGGGGNGKSMLTELMDKMLGKYASDLPAQFITQQQPNMGAPIPELARLPGARFVHIDELDENCTLYAGPMKRITGNDTLTVRTLFKEPVSFRPQLSLIVCTNVLPNLKSLEHGVRRRIRKVDFMSTFSEDPKPTAENPYHFKADPELKHKIVLWREVFMSMLVQKAFETDGFVKDYDIVKAATDEYFNDQDYFLDFITTKIEKSDESTAKIKKSEVYSEFKIWYQETHGKSVPSGNKLYNYLDEKLGKRKRGYWYGYKIKYDVDDVDEDVAFNDDY